MAELSKQEIAELFAELSVAHLCTVRPDGRPHVAPVSYMVEGDKAYVATPQNTVKLRNIRKNPKVSLSIATEPSPAKYVVLEGEATITEDNAARILEHVSIRNYGPEAGPAVAKEWLAAGVVTVIEIQVNKVLSWKSDGNPPRPNQDPPQ